MNDPRCKEFFQRLERLDRGDRARLKRNAGGSLREARGVADVFYNLLPSGVSPRDEECYFLVATLFPLADGNGKGNLGQTLRYARTDQNQKGLDRRMKALLDSDPEQLSFRLRQVIHYLQSARIGIHWVQLLQDLLFWSAPDRRVQNQWARSYYAVESEPKNDSPSES